MAKVWVLQHEDLRPSRQVLAQGLVLFEILVAYGNVLDDGLVWDRVYDVRPFLAQSDFAVIRGQVTEMRRASKHL